MAKDKLGQQIHDAIARRDALTLRRMAAAADREEGRMWLALLARMLELDASRRRRQQPRLRGLVVLPPTRRASLRRAG
ncbi:MAG TPA: hypothetical protein VMT05_11620 [Terriglobales bacterium]|nr:hypothetical protein [Terriglobales bacterium]